MGAKPPSPDLPAYVVEPLERQSPERLDEVAAYAQALAEWKRRDEERGDTADDVAEAASDVENRTDAERIGDDERDELEERKISTDPADYADVPASGAYITVKETRPGYHYYYWQWRADGGWKNRYIGPVDPKGE
ncbi:hypothetical protein [Haloarchaeobius sp. TZWWS8]|uniref:hypothetical protein n=1 Tax=Haloarchaeobius sp. TZWWS8 TaxID=3446121 RepID=UPI003EB7A4E4